MHSGVAISADSHEQRVCYLRNCLGESLKRGGQKNPLVPPHCFAAVKNLLGVAGTPYPATISELNRRLIAFALIFGTIVRRAIGGPNPIV